MSLRSVSALFFCSSLAICVSTKSALSQDPFKENVRSTEWLSPQDQEATFKVPPGFEVQLFASEPQIAKPLNMAFDERGRLWITNTLEYPFAAPPDRPGRDSIKILEDTTGDGRADKITTFADDLNIPMGILPIGNGCIAFSIPNIWKLEDTTGDGKCDRRTILYGPFGVDRDTHGLNNAFRRGLDGWIYACHGFNNQTEVRGKDGNVVTMNSGNTYRFREDGSRIEHFTWGQVNPFGMTMDERGNFFTSDCHSKPLYQLLQGGFYPSFGKPHDGLGFVPEMMEHSHDSTAIDGVCYLDDDRLPREYQRNFLVGNVMTGRVNRDRLDYHGSTMLAVEQNDLVTTTDPWFRPVDIQLGPDGAIYIADFYNKVIGHYEVDLKHPGRDRESGRIWRLVYKGESTKKAPTLNDVSLENADDGQLVTLLGAGNITRRLSAFHELVLRSEEHSEEVAKLAAATFKNSQDDQQRAFCVWILEHAGALDDTLLNEATSGEGPLTRLYACQVLSERAELDGKNRDLLFRLLRDEYPFVQRKAIQAIGLHSNADDVKRFCEAVADLPDDDLMLRHAAKISLRNMLKLEGAYKSIDEIAPEKAVEMIVDVSSAVKTPESAAFLLDWISNTDKDTSSMDRESLKELVQFVSRLLPQERAGDLVAVAKQKFEQDIDLQAELLLAISDGVGQRRATDNSQLSAWATEIATKLMDGSNLSEIRWRYEPITGDDDSKNPWHSQQRASADGDRDSIFFSTLPAGEQTTGRLLSDSFLIPESLTFFCAGHDGFPDKELRGKSMVILVDAESGEVLRKYLPPRNDLAQKVRWDLSEFKSRRGRIELTDDNNASAYAWIAVGRFEPAVVPMPPVALDVVTRRTERMAEIVRRFQLSGMTSQLSGLLAGGNLDFNAAAAIAESIASLRNDLQLRALAELVGQPTLVEQVREKIYEVLSNEQLDAETIASSFDQCIAGLPIGQQLIVAQSLASDASGATQLVGLMSRGKLSPELLRNEALRTRLASSVDDELKEQLATLHEKLPSVNEKIMAKLELIRQTFKHDEFDSAKGLEVFRKQCAACHQVGKIGSVVGPQLDGIGNRGIERIVEDIFLPNRNVDVAFRATVINGIDGRVLNGLFRREEFGTLYFIDAKGKQFSIAESEIDERYETPLSLMPENWLDVLSDEETLNLLAFLAGQKKEPVSGSN